MPLAAGKPSEFLDMRDEYSDLYEKSEREARRYRKREAAVLNVLWQLAQSVSCMAAEGLDAMRWRDVCENIRRDANTAFGFIAAKHPDFKPADTSKRTCNNCIHYQPVDYSAACSGCNGYSSVDPYNLWEGESED